MASKKAFPNRPDDAGALLGWLDLISRLFKSEVYTPTLTNVTNLTDSTAAQCMYVRIGNLVIVGLRFSANPSLVAPTATELGVSLPIPSTFTANTDATGSVAQSAAQQSGRVSADTTNHRFSVQWSATDTANAAWGGFAMYIIK